MDPARLVPFALLVAGCASAPPAEPWHGAEPAPAATLTAARSAEARFETLPDETAWSRMSRGAPPLPVWARALADALPATTAMQLNLDFVQRTRNPLGPVLGAEVRWVVADANHCGYAKQAAEADLAKAGVPAAQIDRLGSPDGPPEPDRAALAFARKLTVDGSSLTDEEVAGVIAAYGPDDVVAIVHTVAHANFQQRIFLALGLTLEPGGAVPPREVRPPEKDELAVPARTMPAETASADDPVLAGGAPAPEVAPWSPRSAEELRDLLEQQKARTGRIPKPDETRLARLPRPLRSRLGRIAWGTISTGYSPELTRAWYQTMDTFGREANLDEVFAESVFWVVTRTNDCFY